MKSYKNLSIFIKIKSFSIENGSSFFTIFIFSNFQRKKEAKKENHKDLVNSNLHILRFASNN